LKISHTALSFFFCFFLCFVAQAQKKKIDNHSYKSWVSLSDLSFNNSSEVSNDGRFVLYKYTAEDKGETFVIQSIKGQFWKAYDNAKKAVFTQDSKNVVILNNHDSLFFDPLDGGSRESHGEIESFEISSEKEDQYVAYLEKGQSRKLTVVNLSSRRKRTFTHVKEYKFNVNGELFVKEETGIYLIELKSFDTINLCKGRMIYGWTLDGNGKQIVFFASTDNSEFEIFYFRKGMDSAKCLINSDSKGLNSGDKIGLGRLNFSPDGSKIFFQLVCNDNKDKNNLNIWSANDRYIKAEPNETVDIVCVAKISAPEVIRLTDQTITLTGMNRNDVLLAYDNINIDEYDWSADTFSIYLISTSSGIRKRIQKMGKCLIQTFPFFRMSPSGNYVIWFDEVEKQYYSYQIATGKVQEISSSIKYPLNNEESDIPVRKSVFGIAGWLKMDTILIYDKYDIWKINLNGQSHPICVTKQKGRNKKIIFRLMDANRDTVLIGNVLLSAFDGFDKRNGIVKVDLNGEFFFNEKCLGNYVYSNNKSDNGWGTYIENDIPHEIGKSGEYIVKRMSAQESANLFLTSDFVSYTKLSDIKPEHDYNWMNAELLHWSLKSGKQASGILYKPENFDSTKKYPVIFNYYEKRSDELNVFRRPLLSGAELNIAWYVSNGYLIFVPDVHYETGSNSEAITNSIVSAVDRLKIFQWIDFDKIGAQGHSFGGYETIVLLTRTNIFRAAQESAGPCDQISGFPFVFGVNTKQNYFIFDQPNLGVTPWDRPDVYLKNSPIFDIEHLNAPLLIMHNIDDRQVSFSQAVELFGAIRRLRKPVWLLKYDNEGHTLEAIDNRLDYNIKQQQFFDYFLRDGALPNWMK
jgi:hypothetical protein